MKKTIWIIVTVAVVILFVLTCPKKEQHKDAIMEKVSAVMEKEFAKNADDSDFGQGLAIFGSMFANKLIEAALDNDFKYKNYIVFSLGQIKHEGEMKTISVGLLNQIFTFSEDDLEDIIEDGCED